MNLIKGKKQDRNSAYEHFCATTGPRGIATVATFAPASTYALARSGLPVSDDTNIHHTASTHYMVVASYDGCMKVFENRS